MRPPGVRVAGPPATPTVDSYLGNDPAQVIGGTVDPASQSIAAALGGKVYVFGKDSELADTSIGPKNETLLHSLGFLHFDHIASWTPEQIEWVYDDLRFNGRIRQEKWADQAPLLAAGDEAKFRRLYGSGGAGARPSDRRPASPGRRSR